MTKKLPVLLLLLAFASLNGYATFILGEGVDIPTLWQGNMKLAYSYYQIWQPTTTDEGRIVHINGGNLGYRLGLGQNWMVGIGLGGGFEQVAKPTTATGDRRSKMIAVGRINLYGRWNFWNEDLGSKAGVQFGSDFGDNYTRTDILNGMGRAKALLVWGTPVGIIGHVYANAGYGLHPAFTTSSTGGGGLLFGAAGFNLEPLVTWHFPLEVAYAVENGDSAHPDLNIAMSIVHYFTQDFVLTAGGRFVGKSRLPQEEQQVAPYVEVSMMLQ
jgi:hypothetical protein